MADDLNINIGANPAGIEAGSRRAKSALKGVADGGRDLDGALRRLRASIDPTFVAMEKYNKVHQDNLSLLRSGLVTRREYNAAMRVAKQALDAETASIQRNSAEGRAAIAEQRRQKAEAMQASRAATAEATRLAREEAAATRQAAREAAAEAKRLKAEERAATRAAAAEAKAQAREQAAAEKATKREAAEAARTASREAQAAAREKSRVEKAEARAAAEAEKEAKRQMKAAARDAAAAAAAAAKARTAAEREAARGARDAAAAAAELARSERQAANAAQELRASIDPAFAAQQRYNETMRRATMLLMQNKLATGEWVAIQKQAKAQMDLNVRSMGQQNAMYVQLGYQAQDVTASLASGINPLVILAQQGGQTAAALSTMGGTAGRVAAFFAGPWGAAIMGATMLIGYLWQANKEGETATKDLMNAEDRRKMKLTELTAALKEYIKAQRESNETLLAGKRSDMQELVNSQAEAQRKLNVATTELTRAQEALNFAMQNPTMGGEGQAGLILGLTVAVSRAESKVKALRREFNLAADAATEAGISMAVARAGMDDLDIAADRARETVMQAYRESNKSAAAYATMQTGLRKINDDLTAAKQRESAARRDNAREAREEARSIHASREAAIQALGRDLIGKGFSDRMENFGVGKGGVGRHPGMGREAHGRYAIDVNIPGAGNEASNPVHRAAMEKEVLAAQAQGYRVLWNGKVYEPRGGGPTRSIPWRTGSASEQHTNHAHIEAPESIVGQPTGSSLANTLIEEAERLREEEQRILEEATRDRVAELSFQQELNAEDMAAVLRYQEEKIAALTAFYGAQSKEVMDANREQVRMQRAADREALEQQRSAMDQRVALAEMADARLEAAEGASREGRGGMVDFAESNGLINAQQAIAAKAAILDEEYANQRAHEERMYSLRVENIRAQLALENLPKRVRDQLNRELETAEAAHLGRMQELQINYARNVQDVYTRSASLTLQKWRDIGSTLSSSMTSAFQGIWTRQQSLQDAFINGADQMIYKFVDMGAKMFEQWFMRQVGMTAVQTAQEGVRTTSTVAAQATQTAAVATSTAAQTGIKAGAAAAEGGIIAATTTAKVAAEGIKTGAALAGATAQVGAAAAAGTAEIGTSAAVAAAGAYKSTVVIPFIGPIAAPAAAALALAAVMGFGALISAKGGMGEVPSDQLAMVHEKEMILPAWIAEPMRQSLRGPRSSATAGLMSAATAAGTSTREASQNSQNAVNFHYRPQHTNMGAGFDELLRKDGRALRKWLKNEVRNGGLDLRK